MHYVLREALAYIKLFDIHHSPEHFSCSLHMWLKGFLELEQHFQHPLAFRRFLSAIPKFFPGILMSKTEGKS